MKKETKLLYIMNVDWSWIRQRPHILAQLLDEKYDLTVYYPKFVTRPWRKQKGTKKTSSCHGIFQIPFADRLPFITKLEKNIIRRAFRNIDLYDIVWLSTPLYIEYIPKDYKGLILYDNMDDIVNIQADSVRAELMQKSQDILLSRASCIFVTSQYLFRHLPDSAQKRAILIRNGAFSSRLLPIQSAQPQKTSCSLGYIGTISEWFDFSLMQHCLRVFDHLHLDLYGPNTVKVPSEPRMRIHGIIEHEQLCSVIENVDCLLMPFILNKVTLAVDPVKLYEYISFGKCIVSIRYPEVERFEPFVYFYETEEQFLQLIQQLIQTGFPPKYNADMQKSFLTANSWEQRIEEIDHALTSLLIKKERNKGDSI